MDNNEIRINTKLENINSSWVLTKVIFVTLYSSIVRIFYFNLQSKEWFYFFNSIKEVLNYLKTFDSSVLPYFTNQMIFLQIKYLVIYLFCWVHKSLILMKKFKILINSFLKFHSHVNHIKIQYCNMIKSHQKCYHR